MQQKFKILLIQDNKPDIELIKKLFKRLQIIININVIQSGDQAAHLITKQLLQPVPHIILLDVNLPGTNGLQLLKLLKTSQKYRIIPVIILTTSDRKSQIRQAYYNYANTYLTKPIDISQFQQLLDLLHTYWNKTVRLANKQEQ